MIYAASDLHGYPLKDFQRLLNSAGFGKDDFLFVLGDVIDRRGDGGIAMLQWMMMQPNVELILGNHEAMLLACGFMFREISDRSIRQLDAMQYGALMDWMHNGAQPTLDSLLALRKRDSLAMFEVVDYIREAPLYDTVCAGGRDFLLVHSGLSGFRPERPLSSYPADSLLWHRPAPDERFFEDVTTILGHTPTACYGAPGRIFRTDTWIDIDTGAGSGYPPALLRLDDMKEFYAEPSATDEYGPADA